MISKIQLILQENKINNDLYIPTNNRFQMPKESEDRCNIEKDYVKIIM